MKQGVDTSAVIYCYMLKSLPYWPLRPSAWSRRTSTCIWHLLVCVCADTFYISDYLCVSLIKELPNFGFITKFITVHLCSFLEAVSGCAGCARGAHAEAANAHLAAHQGAGPKLQMGWATCLDPQKAAHVGELGGEKKRSDF